MAEPGQREPAPAPLATVQAFVNTNDLEGGRERLGSPDDLRAWLVDHELLEPAGDVSDDELRRAIAMREAIRALATGHNHLPADSESAMALLNAQAERARLAPSSTCRRACGSSRGQAASTGRSGSSWPPSTRRSPTEPGTA